MRYVRAAVAAEVEREALAALDTALAEVPAIVAQHSTGSSWAEFEHLWREATHAVFDRHFFEWHGPGGKFERRLRELSR
jgi:hypothetical protein